MVGRTAVGDPRDVDAHDPDYKDKDDFEDLPPRAPRASAGCLGVAVALTSVPVLGLAIAVVTGLGLERNLANFPALAAGVALVLLPVLGLASLIGGGFRLAELGGSGWFWSVVLLVALPLYFPGERGAAAHGGLTLLASPLSEAAQTRVISLGQRIIGLLGEEPEPTPLAAELPGAAAEAVRAADAARRVREIREARGDVVIAYEGQGETLEVAAFFDGPRYGEEFRMVFDTGATYTTLNRAALAHLEIDVPPDAPRGQCFVF